MNQKEFNEKTLAKMKKTFPDRKVFIDHFNTSHGEYDGVVVSQPDGLTPVINLNQFYDRYINNDYSYSDIFDEMLWVIDYEAPFNDIRDLISDLDWVKDHLFFVVCNIEKAQGIGKQIEDLFLQPRILIDDTDGIYSCAIDHHLLSLWNTDEDDIINAAITNAPIINPSVIEDLSDFVGESDFKGKCVVVSTKQKCRGAAALFYDDVKDRITELIGDFIILPSSVNEFICVNNAIPAMARELVKEVNNVCVSPDEWLSNEIYCFKNNEFSLVTD